jgi:AraC-like DNA-binding protein
MQAPRSSHANPEAGMAEATLDTSYVLGYQGFVYASARINSGPTSRPPAVLLLSADHAPFELRLKNGQALQVSAAAVAPRVARSLSAEGIPLLSFNIMPSHPAFHVFGSLQRAGAMALDRQAFAALDEGLAALSRGDASLGQARRLFEAAVAEAHRQLPPVAAPDPLALEVVRMLDADPLLEPAELARRCGRSTQIVSRMFSSAVGMPLRDYQNWLKQRQVLDMLYTTNSLTEVALTAGFGDSPQFSRTFQRWYGQSPSFSRNPKHVRVVIAQGDPPAQGLG